MPNQNGHMSWRDLVNIGASIIHAAYGNYTGAIINGAKYGKKIITIVVIVVGFLLLFTVLITTISHRSYKDGRHVS